MPKFKLQKLSPSDGEDIYNFLQEIPAEQNGFNNIFNGMSYEEFKKELVVRNDESENLNIGEDRVPQTLFWMYADNEPVGFVKIRHYLNDYLEKHSGHMGYTISPKYQGKGYATKMVELALMEAKKLGIDKILITCDKNNFASRRVAEKNGGILESDVEFCRYWIEL